MRSREVKTMGGGNGAVGDVRKRRRRQEPLKKIMDVHMFDGATEKMTVNDLMEDLEARERRVLELKRQKKKKEAEQQQEKGREEEQEEEEEEEEEEDDGGEDAVRDVVVPEPVAGVDEEEDDLDEAVVAPQVQVGKDGKIIINEESLMVTTGQETELAKGPTIEIDPNAYINSMTYMKRENSTKWKRKETEQFYHALRQFGTDFGMMEHLVPGRTRRQIKHKYNREAKDNPEKIAQAERNRLSLDEKVLREYENKAEAKMQDHPDSKKALR
ncbi:hypothetical protein NDN08_004614 [Rhodosorus marinus]|uniref:Myb-like domain-containing protein n=1 Tax=Rhodosorus marinus TaxID=101924 RepID=A0AAV8UPI5_9RHOD|nr:hypothetical protein NDN08_004614 [Rhodosorus marinus]